MTLSHGSLAGDPIPTGKPEAKDPKPPVQRLAEGRIRAVFLKAAGKNKDAVLQGEEFKDAIDALAELAELPEAVTHAKWQSADKNNDGVVDGFEFLAFVRRELSDGKVGQPADAGNKHYIEVEIPEAIKLKYRMGPPATLESMKARENEPHAINASRGQIPEWAFNERDLNGDGTVTFGEHDEYDLRKNDEMRAKALEIFDADNDDKLTNQELEQYKAWRFKNIGVSYEDERAERVSESDQDSALYTALKLEFAHDIDGDGLLSRNEYQRLRLDFMNTNASQAVLRTQRLAAGWPMLVQRFDRNGNDKLEQEEMTPEFARAAAWLARTGKIEAEESTR